VYLPPSTSACVVEETPEAHETVVGLNRRSGNSVS
jgi:hypothetical protein